MQSINKKGLAEVVSTLAMILVTVGAVMLAGYNIMNVIEINADIQSSPVLNCLEAQTSFTPALEITKACYNDEGDIEVRVKRTTEMSFETLAFTFGQETFKCSESCQDCTILGPREARTYYFTPDNQEIPRVTLFTDNCKITEAPISRCR